MYHTRREMLQRAGTGFGMIGLTGALQGAGLLAGAGSFGSRVASAAESTAPTQRVPHFAPRAKRVIFLLMNGAPSHVDTFDPKPALKKHEGEQPSGKLYKASKGSGYMPSPFRFRPHGESGVVMSELLPNLGRVADDLCVLRSMHTNVPNHEPGLLMMNCGNQQPIRPSLGSWVSYGLGSLSDELPEFVVLPDPRGLPYNQKANFSAGFLPARHQGTVIDTAAAEPVPDLLAREEYGFARGVADRDTLAILEQLDRRHASTRAGDSRLAARLAAGELAARMQLSAPEAFDLTTETAATHAAYGLDRPETEDFGRRCLLARRLMERGSRFVQVWSGPQGAVNNWDNHGNIQTELPPIALSVDQPIAALVNDLEERGLLEDTLVVWSTEFGRTPFAQGSLGRDHNGGSFVTWLAGAGVKAGATYGASDDLGYQAAEGKASCYDLHATILYLLGIDHTRLTFRTAGIDRRLTDVHGHVISDVLS